MREQDGIRYEQARRAHRPAQWRSGRRLGDKIAPDFGSLFALSILLCSPAREQRALTTKLLKVTARTNAAFASMVTTPFASAAIRASPRLASRSAVSPSKAKAFRQAVTEFE